MIDIHEINTGKAFLMESGIVIKPWKNMNFLFVSCKAAKYNNAIYRPGIKDSTVIGCFEPLMCSRGDGDNVNELVEIIKNFDDSFREATGRGVELVVLDRIDGLFFTDAFSCPSKDEINKDEDLDEWFYKNFVQPFDEIAKNLHPERVAKKCKTRIIVTTDGSAKQYLKEYKNCW